MPHSVKDLDNDFESKAAAGRMQTRMFTVQSVSSPLRRSSRIKQNKYSSDVENISETDVLQTPGKRTRQSLGAPGTPRVNTRAASRLMRAVSETQSPLPAGTMRKTRASSVEPKSLSDQNKSRSDSPIKTRKRASMLPSNSLAKEQIELEDRIPYVRLDSMIVEVNEITNSGNSESLPDKALLGLPQSQKIKKCQSISKEESDEDESHAEGQYDRRSRDSTEIVIKPDLETVDNSQEKMDISTESLNSTATNKTILSQHVGTKLVDEVINQGKTSVENINTSTSEATTVSNKIDKKEYTVIDNKNSNKIESDKIDRTSRLSASPPKTQIEHKDLNREISTLMLAADNDNEIKLTSESSREDEIEVSSNVAQFDQTEDLQISSLINESFNDQTIVTQDKVTDNFKSTEKKQKQENLFKCVTELTPESSNTTLKTNNSTRNSNDVVIQDDQSSVIIETSVENISTSTNEDTTAVSNKIDKEYTVVDNKNSNKIESDQVDRTSRLSASPPKTQIEHRDLNREISTLMLAADNDNEIKLTLESSRRDEIEVSSNVAQFDETEDLQISSPINESFNDRTTVTQDKVTDNFDSTEEKQKQENLFKCVTELTPESSNTTLKINNSTGDSNDVVIQDNQSSITIETSKQFTINTSPEKTDVKDILPEKIMKRNLKRKSTDVLDDLEREKESLQMETSPKNQENTEIADDDSDIEGIDLFEDIPVDKWKKKNNVKTVSDQSTSQSMEKVENDNGTECDLVLMDRPAWLVAETIKVAKEAEPFEYDSDDTVLLENRLDAAQASYNIKKLDVVDEEVMDIDSDENEKQVKKARKSRTKRRLTSETDQNSSRCTEDGDNLVTADKSNNESKIALNRTNDQSISRLNKSKQSPRTRSSKASDESDKEVENDVSKLNRSSLISNKNTSLRKLVEGRTSLNKSSKDTSMQNVSTNKSRIDDSEEEIDITDKHARKKLNKKKRSSNKSCNDDATEKKNVPTYDNSKKDENTLNRSIDQESKPIKTKITIYLNDDESDNSDISIAAINHGSKTYSTIANVGSENSDDSTTLSRSKLYSRLFNSIKADSDNDTDDSSNDSDINREYNLDGAKQKFSDEDVPADECRASEVEFSDSDDNDSDLADFIVNDDDVDYIEDEEEEKDNDEDMHDIKDDDEGEIVEEDDETAYEEEVKDEDKQAHIDTESINMEDKNEEDEDIQGKDYVSDEEDAEENEFARMEVISSYANTSGKSKNNSIQYTSSRKSDTELKQDIKMNKSMMEKNEKNILLELSNSDLSIKKKKKKSLVNENDTNLSNASNLSSSSMKKDRKLSPQYSSKDGAKRNSSEPLNEHEFLSAKKLPRSRELMKFSTPNGNSCKKLELDEIIEGISENKDIKSDNTITATQNTSVMKKSNKNPALNDDNVKMFSYANKEKVLNSDFSPDLLKLLERTSFSKSTPSKIGSRKTMNIIDTESPTIKHLRKEKLNESAPTLKSNIETSSLFTKKKDITQLKLKEKSNKDEPDLITLSSDDAIRKHSQKKQKHKKRDTSKENITDKALSEGVTEYVPKKKKPVKLAQLTIIDNDIHKDALVNEKKKKKKKQDISKENITNEAVSENTIELRIPKKKKPVKLTQLTIIDDDIHEDALVSEKKKKKKIQDTSKENVVDEAVSESTIELKIPKKKKPVKLTQLNIINDDINEDALVNEKKKKKKIQDTSKENIIDEALFENAIELKIPKKKKRAKLIQLPIVEDNTREDTCLINERKKKKKQTLKGYIEKVLTEDTVESKIPKKKKRAKFSQLGIIEDDIYTRQDVYQINEKEKQKKKKQINVVEEDKNVNEDTYKNMYQSNEKEKKKKKGEVLKRNITEKALSEDIVKLKTSTKKTSCTNLNQLATVYDNADTHQDAYQINEKEKKKKKKKINVIQKDENVNEDYILRKNIRENKTGLAQQKKNKTVSSLKLGLPTDKHVLKKKTKQQKAVESTQTLCTEKNTLPVQIPVSKLKSDKNLLSRKLLQDTLDASKSKNVVHTTKKLDKVTAKMCIPTELKSKKKRDRTEDIENVVHVNVPTKKLKKEMTKFLPSSKGLKRLSDDVIENLTDVPLKAKKRRKISQNEEQVVSSVQTGKSKMMTANDSFTLSNSDCSTQFCVANLQKTKKQPLTGAIAAVSFRRRMLARNNREPISAYMMYCDKMNFIK